MSREECISWFHGKLSRDDAEKLIQDLNSEGGFLVRESFASPGDFVLTLLHNGDIVHYQILRHGEDAFFSIGEQIKNKYLYQCIMFKVNNDTN